MNWYIQALKKYAVFEGRARRKEFWLFVLVSTLISLLCLFLDWVIGTFRYRSVLGLFTTANILAFWMPLLAVHIRRLHDSGRSGWWLLLNLIPLGGFFYLYFLLKDSSQGENRFGSYPKVAPEQLVADHANRVANKSDDSFSRLAAYFGILNGRVIFPACLAMPLAFMASRYVFWAIMPSNILADWVSEIIHSALLSFVLMGSILLMQTYLWRAHAALKIYLSAMISSSVATVANNLTLDSFSDLEFFIQVIFSSSTAIDMLRLLPALSILCLILCLVRLPVISFFLAYLCLYISQHIIFEFSTSFSISRYIFQQIDAEFAASLLFAGILSGFMLIWSKHILKWEKCESNFQR